MKVKIVLQVVILLTTSLIFSQNIYISPNGDDTNDGSQSAPFKTLERARGEAQNYSGPVTIYLRGGTYQLTQPFKLNAENRGSSTLITYRNFKNEHVIISGGRSLSGINWTPAPNILGAFRTPIDDSFFNIEGDAAPITIAKRKGFRQLYVDNIKANRASYKIPASAKITFDDVEFDSYTIESGLGIANNNELNNIELITRQEWKEIRIPILNRNANKLIIDNSNNFVKLLKTFQSDDSKKSRFYKNPLILENDLSFLNEEGEWYFDKDHNWLYYHPLPNQNIQKVKVTIPILESLIVGNNVKKITFQGLTFSHATWYKPNDGYFHRQADMYGVLNSTNDNIIYKSGHSNIAFTRSDSIIFEDNTFTNLGGIGLSFDDGSNNNSIIDNTFTSIASNAISIGTNEEVFVFEQQPSPDDERTHVLLCKNNRIGVVNENGIRKGNIINNVADEYKGSVGIFIGNSQNTIVTDNVISDLPYTAISVGWFSKNEVRDAFGEHLILRNTIDNVVNLLEDGAGIYNMQGYSDNRAVQIEYNTVNIYNTQNKHRAAIYLDQKSNNINVLNNSGRKIEKLRRYYNDGIDRDGNSKTNDDYDDFQEIDMHIYNNILVNDETIDEYKGNSILNNTFGISSLWVEKGTHNLKRSIPSSEIPSISKDGIEDLGVRFVDVNHDGFKDMIAYRKTASGDNFKTAILNTKERLGWRKYIGNGKTTILNEKVYQVPSPISKDGIPDIGSRFVDIDGDDYEDYVVARNNNGVKAASFVFLNKGVPLASTNNATTWKRSTTELPYPLADNTIGDLGCRFVDVNNDGLKDIVLNRYKKRGDEHKAVYINENPGWKKISPDDEDDIDMLHLIPPYYTAVDGIEDIGVRFMDFDGDCDDDMLVHRFIDSENIVMLAYENTGDGWNRVLGYVPSVPISKYGKDNGVRFIDINHDGLKDFVISNATEKNVWLNKCDGWETHAITNSYSKPPINFVDEGVDDNGVRIVDLNGDGFEDIIQKRTLSNGSKVIHYFENRNPQTSSIDCSPDCSSTSKLASFKKENENSTLDVVSMYPNPTDGIVNFNLDMEKTTPLDIKIYSINGTLLKSISNKVKSSSKIDLSNYPSGIYFCVINKNGVIQSRKIIKH